MPENEKQEQARSFTQFLAMLEDGELNAELSKELQMLNTDMNNHAINFGSKAKGSISLTINVILEKGAFRVDTDFKVKKPKSPRLMSILWSTPGNNFTPHNPKQTDMFKDVKRINTSAQ